MTQIPQRRLKIMLVVHKDIDDLLCDLLLAYVTRGSNIGAEISVHTNGLSGIEYLRTIEAQDPSLLPDLIFLGMNLPVYDGFYFLNAFAALNDDYKNLRPVVMLTSSISSWDITKATSYSYVRKYINVPLSFNIIQKAIEELCPPEGRSDTTLSTRASAE